MKEKIHETKQMSKIALKVFIFKLVLKLYLFIYSLRVKKFEN